MNSNTQIYLINSNFGDELALEFIDELTGVGSISFEDRFGPELTLLEIIAILTPDVNPNHNPVIHICAKCRVRYSTYAEFRWHRGECFWTVDDKIEFMEETVINGKFLYWLGDLYESRVPQSTS